MKFTQIKVLEYLTAIYTNYVLKYIINPFHALNEGIQLMYKQIVLHTWHCCSIKENNRPLLEDMTWVMYWGTT